MTLKNFDFASECVTMGHPDKVADQISDAILDAILKCDPRSRVACETLVTEGMCFLAGEISTNCWVDFNKIVRDTVKDIGYIHDSGFLYSSIAVFNAIHDQSDQIAKGTKGEDPEDTKAGDQGMMFGYACTDTPELMPMPIQLARRLCNRLAEVRQNQTLPWLRPDGKTQVTVEYRDGRPFRVKEAVISNCHAEGVDELEVWSQIVEEVLKKVLPPHMLAGFSCKDNFLFNPAGTWTKGGPAADTGLTGRKIIVDTYGGMGRHGGGAFSGKDPSKVDRSAAYAARYIAKNIVAAGLAEKCEVQLSYVIGRSDPRAIFVDTFDTGKVTEVEIEKAIRDMFPLEVRKIIRYFDLTRGIYLNTAKYGHFGHPGDDMRPWEKTDKVEDLRNRFGI